MQGMAADELSNYYADLLDGSYDCVDRIESGVPCLKISFQRLVSSVLTCCLTPGDHPNPPPTTFN